MIRFRLHKVAADHDMTKIKDVAERAGLSALAVSGIWNNTSLRVDLATLSALCHAFNCTPGDLLEYLPEVSPKAKKKS
jgi:putative transcriptional regulator